MSSNHSATTLKGLHPPLQVSSGFSFSFLTMELRCLRNSLKNQDHLNQHPSSRGCKRAFTLCTVPPGGSPHRPRLLLWLPFVTHQRITELSPHLALPVSGVAYLHLHTLMVAQAWSGILEFGGSICLGKTPGKIFWAVRLWHWVDFCVYLSDSLKELFILTTLSNDLDETCPRGTPKLSLYPLPLRRATASLCVKFKVRWWHCNLNQGAPSSAPTVKQ